MAQPTNAIRGGSRPPPTIGIVTALWIEGHAVRSMITDIQPLPPISQDPNHYYQGTLASTREDQAHQVVVTIMSRDSTRNAAAVCTDLIRSFPSVRCVIMAGIAGGIPSRKSPGRHVRLGDIVVATKGIVDYRHVVQLDGRAIPRRDVDDMSQELCRAANELAAKNFEGVRPLDTLLNVRGNPKMKNFARPPESTDILYIRGERAEHPARKLSGHHRGKPKVHHGAIGSADMLLRDEVLRDQIARDYGVVAVEMEGSGIAVGSAIHGKQWFMVRGISDYCENAGKSDEWQAYASLAAAAYVRALLEACDPFTPAIGSGGPPGAAATNAVDPVAESIEDGPGGLETIIREGGLADLPSWPERLVHSLARVPFWQQIANRRILVTILKTRLDHLPDSSDEDAESHLARIVEICLQDGFGLLTLRESLSAMPEPSKVKKALNLIKTATIGDVIAAPDLAELRRLVADEFMNVDVSDLLAEVTDPDASRSAAPANVTAAFEALVARSAEVFDDIETLRAFLLGAAQRLPDNPGAERFRQVATRVTDRLAKFSTALPGNPETTVRYNPGRVRVNRLMSPKAGSAMTDTAKPTNVVGTIDPPPGAASDRADFSPSGAILPRSPAEKRADPPAVWNVPPRNLYFTGREELLASLHTQLSRSELAAVLPQALHGLGGVGKTQLAIEYVYQHQSDYDVIWWIPAEQPQQILSALAELAHHLGLNVGPEANTAVPAVKEALRRGDPFANWLLVFDNAEDAESVQQNIPTGGSGKVLVTSRNAEWMLRAQSLEVDVFDRNESINLLRRRDKQISDGSADRLAEALGDLPLAIEQAAAWRAATGMAVDEYLQLLEAKRPELLGITATSGYESSVAAVWTVSLDRLEQINPTALRLLEVAAFFAPEPIARSLFTTSRASITAQLDEALRDPIKLGRALRDIQRFALARVDHRTDTIQLHRLVQAVVIARIPEDRREMCRHGAHELLAAANPGRPEDSKGWERYAALVSHVKVSEAVACQEPWVRSLVFDIVRYLYWWGDHRGCEDLSRSVFETWRRLLGPDHPETLRIAKFLGYIFWRNGRYAEATSIHSDALGRYERTVSTEDEDLLDAKLMVAINLRTSGLFEEALRLNESVLDDCQRIFGDEPFTLRAAHELGVSLRLAGDFRRALALDAATARQRSVLLGENHTETLNTTNGYTIDLRECGDYRGARVEQERLYSRYVDLFGAANPATIRAGRNLAVALRRAGDHEAALDLSHKVERRFRRRYGPESFDTLAAALNLSVDLRQNKDFGQAADQGARVLEEYERAMGESHPFTLAARTNLAITLRLLGKTQDALAHNLEAWKGMRAALAPDHTFVLICAINLASDKYSMDDHQSAFELDSETLENARRVLGEDHPTTLACSANLQLDLRALGRVAEAKAVHNDVMTRYQLTLGEAHPATVAAAHHVRADCDIEPPPL